jgi:hypothetical protein
MSAPKQQQDPLSVIYNENAVRHNFSVLEYSRTCQSALVGIASGILGLTGINGFLFYIFGVIIQVGSLSVNEAYKNV